MPHTTSFPPSGTPARAPEPCGLTSEQVRASRARYGSNVLTPKEREAWWHKLLQKFRDPLIIILLIAGGLSLGISCYEYWGLNSDVTAFFEPVGIFVAIALATGLAFLFEQKAGREFSLLNQVSDDDPVDVIRDGRRTRVPRRDIVVDDIVLLTTGCEVPADGILLSATSLQVDESSLTGEPITGKHADPAASKNSTYPANKVLRSSKVMEGHAVFRVDAVGDATECGKVFKAVQVDSSVRTPLDEQLSRLGWAISVASYAVALLIVVGRIAVYFSSVSEVEFLPLLSYLLQTVMIAVTLIVVAVPEGLPMAVTLSLAYSMRSMLRTNNLVRRLHACETMGATTVICTDKTGTLTQNQMRVVEVAYASDEASLCENMAVNSTAALDGDAVLGNPTEGALLLWLRSHGTDYQALRSSVQVTDETPFSTERKYMATTVCTPQGATICYLKGAPEIILAKSDDFPAGSDRTAVELKLQEWQARGFRTLAFAATPAVAGRKPVTHFLGIAAIADPVRPDVPAAVRECLDAGIRVKIVTGDAPATAQEIARQVGVGPEDVIARARPLDKKRLVEQLQAQGEVVAVTGDGTNDAPALKAAHVGLSMGSGTSVAKEASDITILDDSFTSIGRAVMWGRSLYRNIQRFLLFQLTVNVVACLVVLAGAFTGTQSPLTVTQMLWVNLIMDTFAAMALSSLPPTAAVMQDPPRNRRAFIISRPMMFRIAGVGLLLTALLSGLLWALHHSSLEPPTSLSAFAAGLHAATRPALSVYELSFFFTAFVLLNFWNLFNARAFQTGRSALHLRGCHGFLFIAALILAGQVLIVEYGGAMTGTVPLSARHWLLLIAGTSPVLWVGELIRFLSRH